MTEVLVAIFTLLGALLVLGTVAVVGLILKQDQEVLLTSALVLGVLVAGTMTVWHYYRKAEPWVSPAVRQACDQARHSLWLTEEKPTPPEYVEEAKRQVAFWCQ